MNAKVNLIALKRELSMDLLKMIDQEAKIHNVVFQTSIEATVLTKSHIKLTTKSVYGSHEVEVWRGLNDNFSYDDSLSISSNIGNSDFDDDKAAEDAAGLTYLLTFKQVRDQLLGIMKECEINNI